MEMTVLENCLHFYPNGDAAIEEKAVDEYCGIVLIDQNVRVAEHGAMNMHWKFLYYPYPEN